MRSIMYVVWLKKLNFMSASLILHNMSVFNGHMHNPFIPRIIVMMENAPDDDDKNTYMDFSQLLKVLFSYLLSVAIFILISC